MSRPLLRFERCAIVKLTGHEFLPNFLVASMVLAFLCLPSYSCSCDPVLDPQTEAKSADAVFSGKVIDIAAPSSAWLLNSSFPFVHRSKQIHYRITFDVREVWKGAGIASRTIVKTIPWGTLCGYHFKKDEQYLVYASNRPNGLETWMCSRTRTISNASEDLLILGPGSAPVSSVPSLLSPLAVVLITVLMLIGVVFMWGKVRSRYH